MITAMVAESIADFGFDRYCIDRRDERLIGPHGPIKLGNKAFRVLLQLIERRGRLVTKDELMSSVWDGTIVSEFSLTSAVKELRRALGDDARAPRFIQSVYGRGYRFLSQIEEVDFAPVAPAAAPALSPNRGWHKLPPRQDRTAVSGSVTTVRDDRTATGGRRWGQDRPSVRFRFRRLPAALLAVSIFLNSALVLLPDGIDRVAVAMATPPRA